jgi:DNA-binding transcriptional regulator LsrR (DeoR family)
MTQLDNRGQMVKAAQMYYLDGRGQDDIARVLGTSRSKVSRMLAAARARGIVEIRIQNPYGRNEDLEHELCTRFDLAHARVPAFSPGADPRAAVAMLAAQWLDKSLRDGQVVALSWGSTLQAVVNAVAVDRPRKVEVVPLVGGLSTTASLANAQELVRELAARLGGSYRYLHAPALLQSAGAGAALRAEPAIREAFDHALSADIAMVGIGAVGGGSSAQILDGLALTPTQRAEFFAANPVGDTCCRFFDAAGNQIQGEVYDRVLAVDLADLPRIPTVIGVATGPDKAPGVLGALGRRAVRGLVVDACLAHAVLAASDKSP